MNTEHLQQCADAGYEECCEFMEPNNRLAFAKATISTYLKLNPVWVKASERMPTREDADEMEYVAVFDYESGFDLIKFNFKNLELFWTSIKHLPPPPDAVDKIENQKHCDNMTTALAKLQPFIPTITQP